MRVGAVYSVASPSTSSLKNCSSDTREACLGVVKALRERSFPEMPLTPPPPLTVCPCEHHGDADVGRAAAVDDVKRRAT